MAPLMFALIAFGVALTVTVTGMAATRLYLGWIWIGTMLFYALWWLLLGYPPLLPKGWPTRSQ
ncbi:hypothetical protein [Aeromonas bivalvium]|uniref:hypothetical protein n=1 Tax=Aeromonas bivalvium TaxID=440079 RepID=UPI0038D2472F